MRCPVPAFDVSLQVKSNFQGTGIVSPLDGVVQIHEKSEPHPWVLVPFMPKFVEVPRPKEKTDSKFGTLAENKAIPRGGGGPKKGGGGRLPVGRILVLRRARGLCDLRVLHESGLRLGIGVSSLCWLRCVLYRGSHHLCAAGWLADTCSSASCMHGSGRDV